jgi:hypothetical protein
MAGLPERDRRARAYLRLAVLIGLRTDPDHLVAVGLLAFAFFCAVNALYRVVPRARSWRAETVTEHLKRTTAAAMR